MAESEKSKFKEWLSNVILEDKLLRPETYNEILNKIASIRDLEMKVKEEEEEVMGIKSWKIPDELFCPFTQSIMEDPVIVATGETYDRRFIEEWLRSVNHTCPLTQEVLTNDVLIPNRFAQRTISRWCSKHNTTLSEVNRNFSKCPVLDGECKVLNSLVNNLSSPSLLEKKLAVKGLRLALKHKLSIRAFVGQKPRVIIHLIGVLTDPDLKADHEVQENVVTALLNLSILESNRRLIGEDSQALRLLIEYLSVGSLQTRCNATAAIQSLSSWSSNRKKVGEFGAIEPLAWNLKHGHLELKRDTVVAIYQLCKENDNSADAVRTGVVPTLLEMIKGEVLVSKSLCILTLLVQHREAAEQIVQLDGVASLLGIIRLSDSEIDKQNAVSILRSIFVDHEQNLKEVKDEEQSNGTLSELLETGTVRAQQKAKGILKKLRKNAGVAII